MAEARVDFSVGTLSFSIEGSEKWTAEQFDKVIAYAQKVDVATISPTINSTAEADSKPATSAVQSSDIAKMTLVAFLQKCGATTNGNRKFLAAALWVMSKQVKKTFTTKDVTSALSTAQQSKLANPSQSLARIVKAGFAEQSSNDDYYVTPEGRKDLGLPEESE